jgi:DUF1707 SHOCT-like domain
VSERVAALRASDRDRARVVRLLRRHLVAGRLRVHEFEERIERAYAATTLDELRELTRDLPESERALADRRRARIMLPGNRPFAVRFESEEPASIVMSEAMRTVAPNLLAARYRLVSSDPTRLVFRRAQFPFWAIAAAILIPIFGLVALAFAGRETSEIVVSANESAGGPTVIDVFGAASLPIRRAMLQLER